MIDRPHYTEYTSSNSFCFCFMQLLDWWGLRLWSSSLKSIIWSSYSNCINSNMVLALRLIKHMAWPWEPNLTVLVPLMASITLKFCRCKDIPICCRVCVTPLRRNFTPPQHCDKRLLMLHDTFILLAPHLIITSPDSSTLYVVLPPAGCWTLGSVSSHEC